MAEGFTAENVRRREDLRLVTGHGCYVADRRLPDMAHAVLLRSPHAHAVLGSIDIGAARTMPGVIAVVTDADLRADGIPDLPSNVDLPRGDGGKAPKTERPLLARGRVRFVGEPVAMVLAESEAQARDAAEAIEVEYAELPAVATWRDASKPGAPALWPKAPDNTAFLWERGGTDAVRVAIANAAHVVRLESDVSRVTASPMEPRTALAEIDAAGRIVLYASHQSPHSLRAELLHRLRLTADQLRVVAADVGGSFGMKAGVHVENVLVPWAARKLGRPVRWVSDRTEGFLSDEQGRDVSIRAELALDREGKFLALHVRYDCAIGAYLAGRSLAPINNIGGIAGVYRVPAIAAEVRGVFTNAMTTAAYRGAGRPEATYVIERLIDLAAHELTIAPYELRRRNLIPPEAMPFKTAFIFTYDSGEFEANMEVAARVADLAGFPARRAEAAKRGRLRGIGIANPIEVAGGPFSRPAKDNARIEIAPDGTVTLDAGSVSVGPVLEKALSQLVAQRLGVPIERIRYRQGDTDILPTGRGNGGSSAICVGGSVVSLTLDAVVEKGRALAAEMLETAVVDVTFINGRFVIAGTDRSAGLAEVARFAQERRRMPEETEPGFVGRAEFQPPAVTFPNGCHIAEVEIDPETGVVELVSYSTCEDIGRIINPMLAHGQMHGGIAQGVGQVLGERIVLDPASGQLLTASYMDYPMPRADMLPEFRIETRSVPTKVNPLGAKGVGEAGTVGALGATMNAICDALKPLGIRHIDMPATPERVWAAIEKARATRSEIR